MCSENSCEMSIKVYLQDSAIRRNIRNSEINKEWGNWTQKQFQTCRFRTTAGVDPVSYTHLCCLYLIACTPNLSIPLIKDFFSIAYINFFLIHKQKQWIFCYCVLFMPCQCVLNMHKHITVIAQLLATRYLNWTITQTFVITSNTKY